MKIPQPFTKTSGNRKNWSTNTGFDSDYLPPESFYSRSVGSPQDGKLSSSPDSAVRIRRFPPFHPFTGFAVRIRRTSRLDRVRESSASTIGHSPFPPVPDSLSGLFSLSRIIPAGILPVSCTRSFQCACSRWRISRKFPFRACPVIPPFPRVPASGKLTGDTGTCS